MTLAEQIAAALDEAWPADPEQGEAFVYGVLVRMRALTPDKAAFDRELERLIQMARDRVAVRH